MRIYLDPQLLSVPLKVQITSIGTNWSMQQVNMARDNNCINEHVAEHRDISGFMLECHLCNYLLIKLIFGLK